MFQGVSDKGQVPVFKYYAMRSGGEWSASLPGSFTRFTCWIGGWVDRRAGLDAVAKEKNTIFVPTEN
jgi:hypothetical protein